MAKLLNPYMNSWKEPAGYLASALVLLTFCMRDMFRLRCIAILSNIAFMAYGYLAVLPPVLLLHLILLPVNAIRLSQLLKTRPDRPATDAAGGMRTGGMRTGWDDGGHAGQDRQRAVTIYHGLKTPAHRNGPTRNNSPIGTRIGAYSGTRGRDRRRRVNSYKPDGCEPR